MTMEMERLEGEQENQERADTGPIFISPAQMLWESARQSYVAEIGALDELIIERGHLMPSGLLAALRLGKHEAEAALQAHEASRA